MTGTAVPTPSPRVAPEHGPTASSAPGTGELTRLTRVPPHDLAAEMSALGGVMLSRGALADVADVVRPPDFYRPAHATVFEAILGLDGRGEPVDAVSVAAELGRRNQLDRVGGANYLHTLVASVPTAANAGYYARIVAEKAVLRRLTEVGATIAQIGYTFGDPDAAADEASAAFLDALDVRRADEPKSAAAVVSTVLDELSRIGNQSNQGGVVGLPTGFADLDEVTQGLHPGQLVVVAARPGLGKSTLGMHFARECALSTKRAGRVAVLFSAEMVDVEIGMRLMSAEARVGLQKMRAGTLDDADWARIAGEAARVADSPLYVDDSPNLTVLDIRAKARRLKQRCGDLALVVVDYLQLITRGGKRSENRQQEVAEISRSLKLLAIELGVPVVAISQLNRLAEQRADQKPKLSDLRESGAIEQDADVVILLYKDDETRAGEMDLILAKHRNGPIGVVTVAAQLHYSRFVDMAV